MTSPAGTRAPERAPERRRLVVVRHAKAEPSAATDHERALTDAGRADAAVAGAWLAEAGLEPDLALVSSALRTRETWTALCEGGGFSLEPQVDDGLYAASAETVVDLVNGTAGDASCVVVVGHNPTMATVASLLDDGDGDPAAEAVLAGGFPTCTVVVLDVEGAWHDLAFGGARLSAATVGRADG